MFIRQISALLIIAAVMLMAVYYLGMPQNWEEWGSAITIIALVGLIWQIYLQRRDHKREAAALLYSYIDTAEYRRAASFIYSSNPENLVIGKLSEDEREQVEFVANAFDRIGFMIKKELMNEDIVYYLYGKPVIKSAQQLQIHLQDQRNRRANEGGNYNPDFDCLAHRFKLRHLKEKGIEIDQKTRELPLSELLEIEKIQIGGFTRELSGKTAKPSTALA